MYNLYKYTVVLAFLSVACWNQVHAAGDGSSTTSTCDTGLKMCGDTCLTTKNSNDNCGSCGRKCRDTEVCLVGRCERFSSECIDGASRSSYERKCVCDTKTPSVTFLREKVSVNFEPPTYPTGIIDNVDGWQADGSAGSGCAKYDEGVGTSGYSKFGQQSFRISNAVTSGCFGDQAFAKPLKGSVGESGATAGTFSVGTKRKKFFMQFDIRSAVPNALQPNLFISVSPDRGDGSRMSYLGFSDTSTGLEVIFYDVQGKTNPANFVGEVVATGLDRSKAHRIRLTMEVKDGPSNDIVNVYINCNLVKTGTTWENYYRYDTESHAEQSVRIVKTVLFRAGGTAAPATSGKGFFFDNLIHGAY